MIKKNVENIIVTLDNRFETDFHEKGKIIVRTYYNSHLLNKIRRIISTVRVKFMYIFGIKNRNIIKLHLGCGNRYIKGYTNIDLRKTKATDLVLDIKKLPYIGNSVERIETYHVIEHLNRYDLIKALRDWYRVLKIGGQLIIESPDFDKIVERYLNGEIKMLDGIFGLQRFEGDYHLFGYNFLRLKKALEESGFSNIEEKEAVDYHIKEWPCLRIECIKGKNNET